MRWNIPHDGRWHTWFAWRPVRCMLTGALMWLEVVDRRFVDNGAGVYPIWRAREK